MVKISYYDWDGGRRKMLLVGNLNSGASAVSLAFAEPDLARREAKDEFTGDKIDLASPLALEPYGFRIVTLEP
jgi:hypothetical protein